jgi:hypothetical protein
LGKDRYKREYVESYEGIEYEDTIQDILKIEEEIEK